MERRANLPLNKSHRLSLMASLRVDILLDNSSMYKLKRGFVNRCKRERRDEVEDPKWHRSPDRSIELRILYCLSNSQLERQEN